MTLSVAKLIKCVTTNEERIEVARTTLAKNAKFSCLQCFKRIDRSNKGYIDEDDLNNFLKSNGIFPQEKEAYEFYSRKKIPGSQISYDEFADQILPQSNFELKHRCLQNDLYQKFFTLDNNEIKTIDKMIALLYEREYKFMKELQFLLKEHRLEAFEKVAHHYLYDLNKEEIAFKNVQEFMKTNYFDFEESDFNALQRRIDRSSLGRISLFDFLFFFFPFIQSRNHHDLRRHRIDNLEKMPETGRKSKVSPAKPQSNFGINPYPDMVLLSSCKTYKTKPNIEHQSTSLQSPPQIKNLQNFVMTRYEDTDKEILDKKPLFHSFETDRDKFGFINCEHTKRIPNLYQSYCDHHEYLRNLKKQIESSGKRMQSYEEAITIKSKIYEEEQPQNSANYTDPEIFYRRYYFEFFEGFPKHS